MTDVHAAPKQITLLGRDLQIATVAVKVLLHSILDESTPEDPGAIEQAFELIELLARLEGVENTREIRDLQEIAAMLAERNGWLRRH